jgi:hypothetical protein
MNQYPKSKLSIVGGGIIGLLAAYYAFVNARANDELIRITIHEKNADIMQTTTANIAPSLTLDEIIGVVPNGVQFFEKLNLLFSIGGIRVEDVPGLNNSIAAINFIQQAQAYSLEVDGSSKRAAVLVELGRLSMGLWQKMYSDADPELKKILEDSNFNPCRETSKSEPSLGDGYVVDLLFNIQNAEQKAAATKDDYETLGYQHCKVLSPDEVQAIDPALAIFCQQHSEMNPMGELVWKNNAAAVFRPGGCLDTEIFIPRFAAYLQKIMGKYTNTKGEEKDCFRLKLGRKINALVYSDDTEHKVVRGLKYNADGVTNHTHTYQSFSYVLCPGEAVGTLDSLDLLEPAYAGFAGASLKLNITIPEARMSEFSALNNFMSLYDAGIGSAWQARRIGNKVRISIAGTKAFYADQKPNIDQDFAKNRHLAQLNMINTVLPQYVSLALNRNTIGQKLTAVDLQYLVDNGFARIWVGRRAVICDGFPTIGAVYDKQDKKIENARCITSAGSGGVSFGPALVFANQKGMVHEQQQEKDALIEQVTEYSSSKRFRLSV